MKKLLVLMLVIGMASLANAAVYFYINGEDAGDSITINPSDVITIQIYSDNTDNWAMYVINEDLAGIIGALSNPTTNSNAGGLGGNAVYDEVGWGYGYQFNTAQSTSPTNVVAGVQHTVDFSSAVNGTTVIGMFDFNGPYTIGESELDTLTITVIPEPATIALLCLGGLLLRKKR